jgi:hypothetical protein
MTPKIEVNYPVARKSQRTCYIRYDPTVLKQLQHKNKTGEDLFEARLSTQ